MYSEKSPGEVHAGLENPGVPIRLEKGDVLHPISKDLVRQQLQESFTANGNNPKLHRILDTEWKFFFNNEDDFKGLAKTRKLLEAIYQKEGDIQVLDIGCGSSQTLFQATEDIEENKRDCGKIEAYGITASFDYLFKGLAQKRIEELLQLSKATGRALRSKELLYTGVGHDEQDGYCRDSPAGNRLRFLKADAHFLDETFPKQKFDLIYSANAFPHFSAPWLAFAQACDALKDGGLLMVDGLLFDIYDVSGRPLSPEQYLEILQSRNPTYKVSFPALYYPFLSSVVVEKKGGEDFDTGLYLATVTERIYGLRKNVFANVYAEKSLKGYTQNTALKSH